MNSRRKSCGFGSVFALSMAGLSPWVGGAVGLGVVAAAPAWACPPSEGDLFLQDYDPSGDGVVMIDGIELRVLTHRVVIDEAGRETVDNRLALVLVDPHRDNHEAMVVKMPTRAAEELRDMLGWSLERRDQREAKPVEKKGAECTLLCKDETGATRKKLSIRNLVPTVTDRREWTDAKGVKQVDDRLTLTLSDWRAEKPPVSVSMDSESARKLMGALAKVVDEKSGRTPASKRPASEI